MRRALRVGMVCPYSLDSHGGVQQHVAGLAGALRGLGHHVAVLAPGDPDRARAADVTALGEGPSVPFNGSVAPVRLGPRRDVERWLAEGAFDVVHVHEPAAPSTSYSVVKALLRSDVRVVATHHIAQERAWALRLAAPTVLRSVLPRVDAHIVVSEEARSTLQRYHQAPATLVPNGVAAADFDTGPVGRFEDRRDLLFVGRPEEPRKGLDVLLRAMPQILAAHPATRLVVVGGTDGDAAGSLPRDLARRVADLGPAVTLLGRLDEADKIARLAGARALVAPNTRGESFGIVLTEAMAAGVPVVASDLPAFRAVLGDGARGLLVRAGDVTDLASGVDALLSDPGLSSRLARAGRLAAHETFDWGVIAPQVLQVYAAPGGARRGSLGWSARASGT